MTTTPRLWKSQTQVNTADFGVQTDGQIAGTHDDGYVVVWHSINFIIGQRYDTAGNKLNSEVIAGFNFGEQTTPVVTVLANGNIAVAFVDVPAADVYVQIFAPTWGSPLRLDAIGGGTDQSLPSITPFADGSYVVAYTAATSSVETSVLARVVSATGVVGTEFALDSQTDSQTSPELATLSNGNFVAVYEDEFNGNATDHDIKYGIFTKTGFPVTFGQTVPGGGNSGLETDPDVAALRDGGFAVVWTDPDSSVHDIRASILSNTGATVASNILVNTTTAATQDEASVVALADGGFLVTWEDDLINVVNAQRFDAVGSKIGAEFTVKNGVSDGFSGDSPEAALLSDGRIAYALGDAVVADRDVVTSIWDPRTLQQNFDGINQSDFLWQNDSGQAAVWLLNGTSFASGGASGPNPGADWHLEGDGDFNKDGHSDFLWQNDAGQAAIWLMNGTSLIGGGTVGPNPGSDWHLIDSGDFNGDGNDDILWQNNGGQAAIWLMNGTALAAAGAAGPNPGADWHIKASGDFNGDGKSDILWQSDGGQAAVWLMNGTSLLAGGSVGPNPGAGWHVIDAGDFNRDGKSDILWQSDSGQAAIWLMNGTSLVSGGAAGPNPGADWHVQGAGQFNGDSRSDILWQHDSGQADVWLMDGTTLLSAVAVGASPGADWHIIS